MTMTPEEIVRHWRQAKKQDAKELQLLAEINAADKDTIRKVLENAGEPLPKQRSKLRGEELKKAIEELYDQRLSVAEFARQVGCTNTTVAAWRKEKGLPRNAEPGWQKQKSPEAQTAPVLPAIYGQMEALLAALPEDASCTVRRKAGDLLAGMFGEYLIERLRLRGHEDVEDAP